MFSRLDRQQKKKRNQRIIELLNSYGFKPSKSMEGMNYKKLSDKYTCLVFDNEDHLHIDIQERINNSKKIIKNYLYNKLHIHLIKDRLEKVILKYREMECRGE